MIVKIKTEHGWCSGIIQDGRGSIRNMVILKAQRLDWMIKMG